MFGSLGAEVGLWSADPFEIRDSPLIHMVGAEEEGNGVAGLSSFRSW